MLTCTPSICEAHFYIPIQKSHLHTCARAALFLVVVAVEHPLACLLGHFSLCHVAHRVKLRMARRLLPGEEHVVVHFVDADDRPNAVDRVHVGGDAGQAHRCRASPESLKALGPRLSSSRRKPAAELRGAGVVVIVVR